MGKGRGLGRVKAQVSNLWYEAVLAGLAGGGIYPGEGERGRFMVCGLWLDLGRGWRGQGVKAVAEEQAGRVRHNWGRWGQECPRHPGDV